MICGRNNNKFIEIKYNNDYSNNNNGYSIIMESGEIDLKRVVEFSDTTTINKRNIKSIAKSMALALEKIHSKYYYHF